MNIHCGRNAGGCFLSRIGWHRNRSVIDIGRTICPSPARREQTCPVNVAPSRRKSKLLLYPGLRRPPGASPGAIHGPALRAELGQSDDLIRSVRAEKCRDDGTPSSPGYQTTGPLSPGGPQSVPCVQGVHPHGPESPHSPSHGTMPHESVSPRPSAAQVPPGRRRSQESKASSGTGQ